jgi:hypothetical protein
VTRPPILSFAPGAGDVVANLEALAEFGAFVEGTSRSGKTNLVRVFLEQTYGQVQHIVLDVEGEYATLRSAERPYLVVGKGRDVEMPAESDAVRRFVLTVVEKSVSIIIDLSEHDTDEQHTIVAAVCDALVSLPESHAGGAAVILEELQEFAPEGGGKSTALPSVRRLSKRGLKRGFFIIGASQRVSDVSKGIVTQLKTKMIGGTDHKDAPRALEELGLPSRDRAAVTDLAQGEFWVKGPAFARHAQHVRVPRSVTAPPKRKRGDPPAPAAEAPAQIAALAKALAAAVAKDEAAEDGAGRTVPSGTLRAPAAATPAGRIIPDAELQRARDEARHDEAQRQERYRQAIRTECEQAIAGVRLLGADVERELNGVTAALADYVRDVIGRFESAIVGIDERWMKPVPPDPPSPRIEKLRNTTISQTPRSMREQLPRLVRDTPPNGALPKAQQAIIDAIAFYESIGNPKPSKQAVGGLAEINPRLSTWRGHMAPLRAAGYVRDAGKDQLELTPEGRRVARVAPPPTRRELHERWFAQFDGPAGAILRALAAVYPATLTKTQLGARVGIDPSLSTWRGYMAPLRKMGLVEDVSRTELRASSLLFPEGIE